MDEGHLRSIVRDAVERHLHGRVGVRDSSVTVHPSHARFAGLERQPEPVQGRCAIEPAVACVHCGYCQSYGH